VSVRKILIFEFTVRQVRAVRQVVDHGKCAPHLNAHFFLFSSNTHEMTYEDCMTKALAELESSSKPNYSAVAKKYGLVRSTLTRRALGETTSRKQFQSDKHQCLTDTQEWVLINQINRLTERGIPPTSQMVKNFAEEIIGRSVGKNWVGQFCRRHQNELKSLYLRNIDNLRIKGEYGPTYKLFYDLVEYFFEYFYCTSNKFVANVYSTYSYSAR
jgi:Tc5 transposase DNA-binding domain